MEQRKVSRLNLLFEKMVANSANFSEKRELNMLYQEYIDEGRERSIVRNTKVSVVQQRA